MISKILIATDGSAAAQKAASYAIDLAKKLKASIFVLSIVDRRALVMLQAMPADDAMVDQIMFSLSGDAENAAKTIYEHLHESAARIVEDVKKLCEKNNIPAKIVITTGHPVEEIIKEAEKLKVDLIVMGSQGHSALAATVLGSVTYGVIHKDTKIPVMVVRV